jgi:hypothetical protein
VLLADPRELKLTAGEAETLGEAETVSCVGVGALVAEGKRVSVKVPPVVALASGYASVEARA